MNPEILGIHHVTAIATDPRTNLDFYTRVLGLRLVKKTVNFDDPGTYHLYFGDELGHPGTILTFFPWPGARRGSRGAGQATATAFAVPEGSVGFWTERLAAHGVVAEDPAERLGEEVLTFLDPDGLKLELVAEAGAAAREPWSGGPVPAERAIRGFSGVTLTVADAGPTVRLLTEAMGFAAAGESGERMRFTAGNPDDPGTRVDVLASPGAGWGRVAAGTVHHVAFRVAGDPEQEAYRTALGERGLRVTPVQDRQYFHSIYFREPGGVLFEIATDPPGMTLDESPAELGGALKLPPWLEAARERIQEVLPELETAGAAA